MLRKLILHINNSQKLLTNKWEWKMFNKKSGNVTFLGKIDSPICPNEYEYFQVFF